MTITPFPLGAFVGGLNGSDPAAKATLSAQYAAFSQTMGAAPSFMDSFVDYRQPISSWASNASWSAWSWTQFPFAASTIPVIALPMATLADRGNPVPVFKAFAAGTYDTALRGVVTAWAQQGFPTMYIRPGWEANGDFMPWYPGTSPQVQADFVAAFQHIAAVLRSVPNTNVKIVWNPNVASGNPINTTSLYPGDASVDVIAADVYSPMHPRDLYNWEVDDGVTYDATFAQWAANPVNRTHYFTYPDANKWYPTGDGGSNSFSLQNMIDFANAHGKPIGIAETGAGGDGSRGPLDDPAFPAWLADTLHKSNSEIAFVNIWDLDPGDGDWDFSSVVHPKPLAAAAWGRAFGAANPPVAVGNGPDRVSLSIAEDAYRGHAQFTVSVDGVQIGGALTASASHAAHDTSQFDVLGSFGAGPHAVTVRFLNDAWGGTAALDRNLYVETLQYGGTTVKAAAALLATGAKSFGIVGATAARAGTDTVLVRLSEDAYLGDAQFSVLVDGRAVGGVQSVTALHGTGSQVFAFTGQFGRGAHTVSVSFLNDKWGGTAAADRNLYVSGVSLNGISAAAPQGALLSAGTANFSVPASVPVAAAAAQSAKAGQDTLTFELTADAYQGDAQCLVSIDGRQLGATHTIAASHTLGETDSLTFTGTFGPGPHTVAVRFTNDAWGGAGLDRNLYLTAVDFNGTRYTEAAAPILSNGAVSFTIPGQTAGLATIEATHAGERAAFMLKT